MTKIWVLLLLINCEIVIGQELMIYYGEGFYPGTYWRYHQQRSLYCISDDPTDAIIWNTNLQWYYSNLAFSDRTALSLSEVSNPKIYNNQCYLNFDSNCLSAWTQHNSTWTHISSFEKPMGPVFDFRWEKFPEYQTFEPPSTFFRPINNPPVIFNETSSISVSIRGFSNAHLALCESDNYQKDLCYWIIIGGWSNNSTAIRKCPEGLPSGYPDPSSECSILKAYSHFPLSSTEWKTFVITWESESQTISLYDPNKKVFSYTDNESSKKPNYRVFYRSANQSIPLLFRFHEYTYTLTTQPEAKLTSPPLVINNSQDFCVDILIGLCRECELFISLVDQSGSICSMKKFSGSVPYQVDHELPMWQSGRFTVSNFSNCQGPLRLEITTSLKASAKGRNNHWAISNLQECYPEKTVRKLSMIASQDYTNEYYWPQVSCQRLSYSPENSKVVNSVQEISTAPSNKTLCKAFYIGPYCETNCNEVFGKNCNGVTICDENGCFCSQGRTDSNCNTECPYQLYGYGCSKKCNNCLNDYCHPYTGVCVGGCKQIVGHYYIPPYCEIDIGPPQAPNFDQNNETSIRVFFNGIEDYKKINATFVFELLSASVISDIKNAEANFSSNSPPIYFAIFNNLTPGTEYSVRVRINIRYEEKSKNILGDWLNFTTTCTVDQDFIVGRYERSLVFDTKSIKQTNYSCPNSWYSVELSIISSSSIAFQIIKKYDTIPQFPLLFSGLFPFTKYKISVTGRDGKFYYNQELLTLEAAPSSVIGLNYDINKNNELNVEWHSPLQPNGILQGYNLTIQITHYGGCAEATDIPKNLTTSQIYLITNLNDRMFKEFNNLLPYVTYEITVIAYNSKLGAESKISVQTYEAEIPTGKFRNINISNNKITWENPVDCWGLNGPIGGARLFFSGVSENVQNFSDQTDTRWHSFELDKSKKQKIYGAEKYYVRVHLLHKLYGSHNDTAFIDMSFITDPKPPPRVKNLEIIEVDTENRLTTLRWEKPSPPTNGEIVKYCIKFNNEKADSKCVDFDSECELWKNLLCATVKQSSRKSDFIEVRGYNKGVDRAGEVTKIQNLRIETTPKSPKILHVKESDKGIVFIEWQHPLKTGGPLKKFIIKYDIISTKLEKKLNSNDSSSIKFPISSYKPEYKAQLNLLPSTHYRISIFGVNSYPGIASSTEIDTPSSLAFEYEPQAIIDNEESEIKMIIPPIVNNTRGSKLHIIVKGPSICKLGTMLSESIARDLEIEYHEVAWRAATFSGNKLSNSSFTIGNNEIDNETRIVNCPLHVGASYVVFLVLHENNSNPKTIHWGSDPLQIGPVPNKSHENWAIPLVIIFLIAGGAIYYYIKKRNVSCLEPKDEGINTKVLVRLSKIHEEENVRENKLKTLLLPPVIEQRESLLLTPDDSIEQLKIPEMVYENLKNTSLVKLNEFQDYVKEGIASGQLDEQYAIFPRGQTKPWEYGKLPQNKQKNRYGNLIAYDETRVILEKLPDDPFSDYINANYIKGYKKNKAYIATQGPKPNTLNDFWRMIWDERVQIICMLANILEGGKKKCEQYWPEIGQEMKFGKVSVTNISHTDFADYIVRIFHVTCEQETRKIDHFHYTAWPDHGIPLYTQSVVTYLKKLLATPSGSGPVLVHCSAGVGRTGTIILCDICLRRAAAEGVVDVFGETELIRSQRANMVDNKQQYLLAHIVLVECLLTLPTAIICNDSLSTKIQEYKKQLHLQQQRLEDSFWQDEALKPSASSSFQLSEKNLSKNRFPELAPPSKLYIPRYPTTDDDSDYISGVYVDGARRCNNFIASQIPLPSTVGDFWRMISELKIELIIMLQSIDQSDPTCCKFFPEQDEELKPVPFINLKGRENLDTDIYIQQKILLTDSSDKTPREQTTTLLICKEWNPGKSEPPDPSTLVKFWQSAEKISRNNEPTVVLCYDGVTGCGLYLAMSFLLERMGLEHECDVCLSIRVIRRSRKDFCKSLDQFEYLYESALIYADYFETYANFS